MSWVFPGWNIVLQNNTDWYQQVEAADGGGTNTVGPPSVAVDSTGNTFTFTYTGDATKDSGGMTIAVPSGWSAPQGDSGTAGYTTVSSSGIAGTVQNALDATTNWTAGNHMTLSADTSDYKTSTGSLSNDIVAQAVANEQWYYSNASAQNWGTNNGTGNLHVGMWLKSSVTTSLGDLDWQDDDSEGLASVLDSIDIAALTADTWTYTSVILGATSRLSIMSYGLKYITDFGAATVKLDDVSSMFDDAEVITNWSGDTSVTISSLTSGQQEGNAGIRCTYADGVGIGTSGDCHRSKTGSGTVGQETLGTGTTFSFWIRSSVATDTGDFDWVYDDSATFLSPIESLDIPALSANTWTYVTLSAASSSNTIVKSWGVRQQVDKGALTIDLDAMGKVFEAGDATTSWTATEAGNQTLSADTGTKKEGTGSLLNTIGAGADAGDKWWETFGSAQDWSGYTNVGVWVRSSVNANSGDLQFEYDDTDKLASPIATLDIGALTANTWSYQKLALSGTRTSVKSYGIKYTTDIGAASVYLDYALVGPGLPTFSGSGPWLINVVFLALANTETVIVTYGSGGGATGVTAPSGATVDTFTTQTRDASDGTLTNISSSPTIEAVAAPVLATLTFTISDNAIGFGTLSTSAATWANGAGTGSATDTAAHTMTVATNATSGYTLAYCGATLTSGSSTIDVASITNDADGSQGTEQFGMGFSTDGDATIATGYDHNAFSANRDWAFVANASTELAYEDAATATETISAYYLVNIAPTTDAGTYSTSITYILTGFF
ncbi:MAG: hypothetical protein ABIG71_00880 [Candidatus Uhrbacteria bacterium]